MLLQNFNGFSIQEGNWTMWPLGCNILNEITYLLPLFLKIEIFALFRLLLNFSLTCHLKNLLPIKQSQFSQIYLSLICHFKNLIPIKQSHLATVNYVLFMISFTVLLHFGLESCKKNFSCPTNITNQWSSGYFYLTCAIEMCHENNYFKVVVGTV